MATQSKTIEKTFTVKIAKRVSSGANQTPVVKNILKVSSAPQSESQSYLDSTNQISVAIFPRVTKITHVVDFNSSEFESALPKHFGSGSNSLDPILNDVNVPKTLNNFAYVDVNFGGSNGSQTNDVNLESNLTPHDDGTVQYYQGTYNSIPLSFDSTFTFTINGYTFYCSNPHVQVVACSTSDGGVTFNARINPVYASLYTAGNQGQSLGTVYVAVNIDGTVYNSNSITLYYNHIAPATKSLTPSLEIYPNTNITNVQYSADNGATWAAFTGAVNVPTNATCKVKATFSKTGSGMGFYSIEGGGEASFSSSISSYTMTSTSFVADADKYIIFYSSKSGQRV